MREVDINEDDIPAEEEAKSKGSWFPCKNEDCRRKKSACKQKIKRKKKIISLGRMYCDLFFYYSILIGLLMSDMVYPRAPLNTGPSGRRTSSDKVYLPGTP